ncbi:hypothetical protein, partial [Vibrio breoganii]|uniref:hypothetical protein n=1 Tax=Vibrio breoganii TaxID=553239 RepID=UPI001A7E186A
RFSCRWQLEASSFKIVIAEVSYRQSHHLCTLRSQLTTCWDDGLLVAGSLKLAALRSSLPKSLIGNLTTCAS